MNKSELVRLVAKQTKVDLPVVEDVVEGFVELVTMTLSVDEDVSVRGFGKFHASIRGPAILRNPKTGEPVSVGPRRTATFLPSTLLKERLNSNGPL